MKGFLSLLVFCSAIFFTLDAEQDAAKLTLTAQAILHKPADQLTISIGVVTKSDSAERALKENNFKMNKVIEKLHELGLTTDDYKTGRFQIRPVSEPTPKDPQPNWQPSILGYEISNTVDIKTEKIDLIGEMIDAATVAGANEISEIQFLLKNPRSYRSEAIEQATKNAIADATQLASSAGIELSRILNISLDSARLQFPTLRKEAYYMRTAAPPPIEAGDVTIDATVTIIYEIR